MAADRDDGRHPPGWTGWDGVLACLVLAAAAAVVAGFAWSRPTTVATPLPYTQSGRLTYHVPTSPSSVYGPAGLSTGEPIYTGLVTTVPMAYSYRFESPAPVALAGTEQMSATISNGQGISRTIPLQPATAFRGTRVTASGTLDLQTLQGIATAFDQVAGAGNGGTYDVDISSTVDAHGRLGSVPFRTHFAPQVAFTLSSSALVPNTGSGGAAAGDPVPQASTGGGPSTKATSTRAFGTSTTGSVQLLSGRSATLFLGLPVLPARIGSLLVLALSLGVGVFLALPLLDAVGSDDEKVRIQTRYGPSLIEAAALRGPPTLVAVDLTSFEALAQVAHRLECPVLHTRHGSIDVYAVVDNGTLYRYCLQPGGPMRTGQLLPNGSGEHATPEGNGSAPSTVPGT